MHAAFKDRAGWQLPLEVNITIYRPRTQRSVRLFSVVIAEEFLWRVHDDSVLLS